MEAAIASCHKRLDEDAWRLAEPELVELTRRLHHAETTLATMSVQVLHHVEERSVPATAGATSTRAWLSQLLRITPRLAKERLRLAAGFQNGFADTGAALVETRINYEQAVAILATVDGLPTKATAEDKVAAERFLLQQAAHLNADDLRRLGKRIDALIDPDGAVPREEAAKTRRGLVIRNHHDGTQTIAWRETDENIALVKAAMAALAAPVPAADGSPDPRTPSIRQADAMLDLVRQALRHGEVPTSRGERPRLVITAAVDVLRTQDGFGTTNSGEAITGAAIRRIACDADLFGIVMTRLGAPLRMGRRRRTVSPTQWVALCARDHGCVFPGCTRPAEFCIAHHIVHWADGGPTDLDNLALLCGRHHDAMHHQGWDMFLSGDRHPRLRPPAWIDPERPEMQNTYWTTQRARADALRPDRTEPD